MPGPCLFDIIAMSCYVDDHTGCLIELLFFIKLNIKRIEHIFKVHCVYNRRSTTRVLPLNVKIVLCEYEMFLREGRIVGVRNQE